MLKALAPGFLLTVVLGVTSYFVSTLHDALDALVVALVAGMIFRLLFGGQSWFVLVVAYAKDLKDVLIPIGVLFYSATININKSLTLSMNAYLHMVVSVAVLLVVALVFGRLLKLPAKTNWLTAIGSAICGASAIAISSTAIDAKDEDISNSLIAITLVGLIALALYQVLPFVMGLRAEDYAILSGATLHQTGIVKIATSGLGEFQKNIALPVKVLRTALIPFIALVFFYITVEREGYKKGTGYLLFVLIAFFIILGLSAFLPAFAALSKMQGIKIAATVIFSIAFANLGLLVDFKTLRLKPIIVAFIAWAAALGAFMLMV